MSIDRIIKRRVFAGLMASAACFAPHAAMAQTAPAPEADNPDTIIVTAQRRSERLIDVPISITAITSEEIERRGVTNLNDMQTAVPGLRIVELGVGTQRIQIRGISQFLGLPTVGNYIDEFPVNNYGASGSNDIRLIDMERVEVLRGPQPTLYGESSMGGTIRYVTASPDLNDFGGSASGEINSVKDGEMGWRAEGVLNLPIVNEKVGLRLVAAHEKTGGWVDTPLTTPAGKDVNGAEYTTIRGKLLLKPIDDLSISLMVLHQNAKQNFKNYSNRNGVSAAVVASPLSQKYTLGNLIISYDGEGVSVLSTTGYMRSDGRTVDDSGPFYASLGLPFVTALSDSRGRLDKFSQEIRFTSNFDGPVSFLVGANYTRGKTTSLLVGRTDPSTPFFEYDIDQIDVSETMSAFGNVGFDFSDAFHLDVGGRYFSDRRTISGKTVYPNAFGPGVDFTVPTDEPPGNFESFNPRVALTLKTGANGTIFANAAKGFRSGGFNVGATNPLVQKTFGPETLWSYEVGTKQSLFDGKLYVEIAGFYNKYDNIQTVSPLSGTTITSTTNSGEASGPGFDVSVRFRPTQDLSLSGTVGYSDIKYDTTSSDRFKGEPLDLVPPWTYNIAVDFTPNLTNTTKLKAHVDYGYTDAARITLHTPSLDQIKFTESRAVLNGRLGANFGPFEAYIFADNLLDSRRVINPDFGGYFEPIFQRPRTIGAGAKFSF